MAHRGTTEHADLRAGGFSGCLDGMPRALRGEGDADVPCAGRTACCMADRLAAAGCVAAIEEAALLVAAAPDEDTLEAWVRRRETGEPLAWITGTTTFGGRPLRVDPGVYVPRPQTEGLARRATDLLTVSRSRRAVDLCTGAGAVAAHLAAEVQRASVVGVDVDRRAAACARRNGVVTLVGDLDRCLRPGSFDVVTAVAPYVPTPDLRFLPADVQRHEPRLALDGGPDGLDVVRRVVASAARLLRPEGWLLVELGGDQDRMLGPTLAEAGFTRVAPWFDEDGDLRGLAARAGSGERR
jgi:release factor glutamine methyltransferase